jgi:hypothetical protein
MSLEQKMTVSCPQCQKESEQVFYDSINVVVDPLLKAKVLDHSFALFRCHFCQAVAPVQRDMLYHDPAHCLMIFLHHDEKQHTVFSLNTMLKKARKEMGIEKSAPEYTIRLVHSANDLVEKVRIFQDAMNDKILEVFKVFLLDENNDDYDTHIYYDGLVEVSGKRGIAFVVFRRDQKPERFSVALKDQEKAFFHMEELLKRSGAGFELHEGKALKINRDFAVQLLTGGPSFVQK